MKNDKSIQGTLLVCDYCKKEFYRRKYRIKSIHVFCSHSCQVSFLVSRQQIKFHEQSKTLECPECGKEFTRTSSYVFQNLKRYGTETKLFCSRVCKGRFYTKNIEKKQDILVCSVCGRSFIRRSSVEKSFRKHYNQICCSRTCAISVAKSVYIDDAPFRKLLVDSVRRSRVPSDIDVEYIKQLWKSQSGICPYTGFAMELRPAKRDGKKHPLQASLDRIDSSIGYIRGNVEIVCLFANYAKNSWERDVVMQLFSGVYAKRKSS